MKHQKTSFKFQTNNKFQTPNIKKVWSFVALLSFAICHLSFTSPVWGSTWADPMRIGVGARSMGMGKAYAGLAEDGDAIFLNPAGIAKNPKIKLTSMYTNLLNDVNYAVLGGIYPVNETTAVGMGYVGAQTGDIILRSASGTQEGTSTWNSNVLMLSAATNLPTLVPFFDVKSWGLENILVGGNLKYYSTGTSGDYLSNDNAFNMDIATLVPITNYANIGLNAENILPTTFSESKEEVPYCYKLGAKVTLLGREEQALFANKNYKLSIMLDNDFEKGNNFTHAGIEFWPAKTFALRVGSDAGELTAGAGIRFSGIAFDYAYHPYYNVPENATHYFSFSYVGEPSTQTVKITLNSPDDKSIIYEDNVQVSGKVELMGDDEGTVNPAPITLKINKVNVPVAADSTFDATLPVAKYGKNMLEIRADAGAAQGNKEVRLVRLASFSDVSEGYWAKNPIENTSTIGLVQGYPDGSFRPSSELTRAELATLLVRARGIEPSGSGTNTAFKDIKSTFWAAAYIEEAERLGLIKGYKTKDGYVFRPNNTIKQSEAITILARFDNLPLNQSVASNPYTDVSVKHWAAPYIEAAKNAGMLSHVNGDVLKINAAVSRAQTVKMLSQTSVASSLIKDLYTWEIGFKQERLLRPNIKASLD